MTKFSGKELHNFLKENRQEILELTQRRISNGGPSGDPPGGTDDELIDSIPELFDDLVAALRQAAGLGRETKETSYRKTAAAHGAQRLRLGFTVTQLVHDYGALCHSITEMAKGSNVTPGEFQILNQVLDVAIANAVAEYAHLSSQEQDRAAEQKATEQLGFVAHELRNAISAAMLSFDAIRRGQVAITGHTSGVLERSLLRMKSLIDKSLTEVRIKAGLALNLESVNFRQLLEDVEATVAIEAARRGTQLFVLAPLQELVGLVDRQLMDSALSNLAQNAIKYSPPGSAIHLRCGPIEGGVAFEVEDECGGIPEEKIESLFSPFVRGRKDGGGLGLGLAITRQAVEAHRGKIKVRNLPGKGCVFTINIPLEEMRA